jgi:hypothetical protein
MEATYMKRIAVALIAIFMSSPVVAQSHDPSIGSGNIARTATPSQSSRSYDGNWSVVIITEKGTCDRAYRYPVRITGGSVGYAGEASFNVSGRVAPNGSVTVSVSRGEKRASGSGKLSGDSSAGSWSGGECSGTWQAERRS